MSDCENDISIRTADGPYDMAISMANTHWINSGSETAAFIPLVKVANHCMSANSGNSRVNAVTPAMNMRFEP